MNLKTLHSTDIYIYIYIYIILLRLIIHVMVNSFPANVIHIRHGYLAHAHTRFIFVWSCPCRKTLYVGVGTVMIPST